MPEPKFEKQKDLKGEEVKKEKEPKPSIWNVLYNKKKELKRLEEQKEQLKKNPEKNKKEIVRVSEEIELAEQDVVRIEKAQAQELDTIEREQGPLVEKLTGKEKELAREAIRAVFKKTR